MRAISLQARFRLAGLLLVSVIVLGGVSSSLTLYKLSQIVEGRLQVNQQTIDAAVEVARALEREDDALLVALSLSPEPGNTVLSRSRLRVDESLDALLSTMIHGDRISTSLCRLAANYIREYRAAANRLLNAKRPLDVMDAYRLQISPLLRVASKTCNQIREANYRSMQQIGIQTREEARQGAYVASLAAIIAVVAGIAVAVWLAWSVVGPVRELTVSVNAVRAGDFDRRVSENRYDELGQLARGFNRMAEALGAYRRSTLGEVMAAKTTLEGTLNSFPEGVFVFGPEGELTTVNPPARAILEALGTPGARTLADMNLRDEHRAVIAQALSGSARPSLPADFEQTLEVTLDGTPQRLLPAATPIPSGSVKPIGAVLVLHNVTAFARLDEMRSELIGMASHELNTPLTTLRMNLLMLGESTELPSPRQKKLMESAVEACEDLGTSIDELLDVTRIEAGQLRLQVAPIDFAAILEVVRKKLWQRFEDANIRMDVESHTRSTMVLGDPARLRTVLSNVLGNALKYSPHGGRISVIFTSTPPTDAEMGKLTICVGDDGPGVPIECRERVFDKFFRVEHVRSDWKTGVRGTGIGLYLCREILRAHSGTISCGDGEGGKGTRIRFTLPMV